MREEGRGRVRGRRVRGRKREGEREEGEGEQGERVKCWWGGEGRSVRWTEGCEGRKGVRGGKSVR